MATLVATEEVLRQLDDLESAMFDLSGFLAVTEQLYEGQPIPAPLKSKKDKVAKILKRKKGKWLGIYLHHPNACVDNKRFKILKDKIDDSLRNSGYDTSDETSDNDIIAEDNDDVNNEMPSNATDNVYQLTPNESENCNVNMCKTTTNVENYIDGGNSQMDIDPVNLIKSKLHVTENLNTSGVSAVNGNEVHNGIGEFQNSDYGKNCVLSNVTTAIDNVQNSVNSVNCIYNDFDDVRNINKNGTSNNSFVYTVPNKNIHNCRIINNWGVTDSGLPLKNNSALLANLPTEDSSQTQNASPYSVNKPKIPSDNDEAIPRVSQFTKGNKRSKKKIQCKAKKAGEFVKLFCQTPENVRTLTEFLDSKGKEYFVIPERAEKPIKGLPVDMDIDVHLFPTANISEIYKLDCIDYTIVEIEPYENRHHHQCFNCPLWNHGSAGCKLSPKCVVCAGAHSSKNCPNKGKEEIPTKCANCNGPHTASYKGCPKYPKNIQKSKLQPGKSFAAATRNASLNVNKPNFPSARTSLPPFRTKRKQTHFFHRSARRKLNQSLHPTC
ncbi:hypothetical protein AVEN_261842-1 [Araneus ventricosus]|uniref:Nucleic-acid-binding protein from transposon X-element n=1 Tax=Araneus ventricosus TaxID=182803 RepID=A0A4Y2HU48_ARAVE|nr:hypothetical protein AVEN_261842-1 [Araneus ventricosus]